MRARPGVPGFASYSVRSSPRWSSASWIPSSTSAKNQRLRYGITTPMLRVRPVASLAGGELYARGDDRGHDACNHDWDGIFVLSGAGVAARGRLEGAEIYDVGATVLSLFEVAPPVAHALSIPRESSRTAAGSVRNPFRK